MAVDQQEALEEAECWDEDYQTTDATDLGLVTCSWFGNLEVALAVEYQENNVDIRQSNLDEEEDWEEEREEEKQEEEEEQEEYEQEEEEEEGEDEQEEEEEEEKHEQEDDKITCTDAVTTNDEEVAVKCFTEQLMAAKQDSNWEKVRQEVTCAICLELLDDPKSMPCLHTYCKKCLMEALAKRPRDPDLPRDRPAINCPLCRAEVALSDQGIEALPTNFSATRLVETVQLQDKLEENKLQKCDSCFEGDAIAICYKCGRFFLCANCFKVHKQLPSTKNHSMLSLNQFMQANVPVLTTDKSHLCQKHPQELLKLYCEDCETLVCRDCVLVKHKTHDSNFIDDIIESEKEHLQDVTLVELEEILTSTKEAMTGVEKMQAEVLIHNDDRVNELDEMFQKITDLLNSRKRTFLNEVRQVTEDDLCPLQKQQEDLMILKQKVESCRDFTQKTLRDGTSTEIMSAKKQMLERTKHLQELHNSSPLVPVTKPSTTIFYQMDKIKEVVRSLGVVVDLQQSSIEDIPANIHVDESASIKVTLKDTKGQPICNASKAITAKVTFSLISSVTAIVLDMENGNYSVIFTPTTFINHIVSIQVNGSHISGSPVELKIDVKHSLINPDIYNRVFYGKTVTTSDTFPSYTSKSSKQHSRSSMTSETKHHSFHPLGKPKKFNFS